MQRKTFDILLTAVGGAVTIVLFVAGGLLMWGYTFAHNNVHDQLAQQQIFFPPKGSPALASPEIGPYLNQYAGQQVLTGPQAQTYANHFIAVHLSEMPYKGVYSQASAALQKDPTNTQLQDTVNTIFKGTTLRGLLLEAYGFSVVGQIALVAGISAFAMGVVMLILTLSGVWHLRKVDPKETLLHDEASHPEGSQAPAMA